MFRNVFGAQATPDERGHPHFGKGEGCRKLGVRAEARGHILHLPDEQVEPEFAG